MVQSNIKRNKLYEFGQINNKSQVGETGAMWDMGLHGTSQF
jgi:hypothetical protein